MFVLFWENRCIQELTHCENNLSLLRNYGRGVLKQVLCLNLFKSFTLVKLVKSFLWGPACPGTESLCSSGLYGFHIPLCKYENSSGTLPHSCYPHSSLLYSLSTSDKSTIHSLSKPAAPAHKNISLFYYDSHVSNIALVVSCAKRIPIPVSLESESIRPAAQFTQRNIIPFKWVDSVLHKQRVCSLFQTGEDFFFFKARLETGKECFVSSSSKVQEETKDWSENKENNPI